MSTYRDAASSGEFRALFGGRAAGDAASTMQWSGHFTTDLDRPLSRSHLLLVSR